MNTPTVEVGQRFESLGPYQRHVWEVEDVYRGANNLMHAKLRDVTDGATYRTLAPEVLLDETRFRPLTVNGHGKSHG